MHGFGRVHLLPVIAFLVLSFCLTSTSAQAQVASTTAPTPSATPAAIDRSVSLRQLPGNLLADQKDIWLFPSKLAKGKHWWPTIAVLRISAVFLASDPYITHTLHTTT